MMVGRVRGNFLFVRLTKRLEGSFKIFMLTVSNG